MKKRYKAIFGNPPYSVKTGDDKREKKNIWHKFSETSIEEAEEVYYITPQIWNGSCKTFMKVADKKIGKVDLSVSRDFSVAIGICYWNTHKKGKMQLEDGDYKMVIDKMDDIKYLPADIVNSLSIHKKAWQKENMGLKCDNLNIIQLKYKGEMKRVKDDEYKYPVFSTGMNNLYYINEKGSELYREYYGMPKIIMGKTRDVRAYFDRKGEYATTTCASYITDTMDNLEIRYQQFQSKFYKFWMMTGRQEYNGHKNGMIYSATRTLFPNIPLSITSDDDIHKWLGLDDDEIKTIEKHAKVFDDENVKRDAKHAKVHK